MTITVTPPKANIPVGFVTINGQRFDVQQQIEFVRFFYDVYGRVGGTDAKTNTELAADTAGLATRITADEAAMITGTYDATHDERVLSLRNTNGADLPIDELLCWDIHYWLTRAEIADTRAQNGPTLNLTTQVQFAIDSLVAKFAGPPNPLHKSASMAGTLRFHHSYLLDGLDWHPAIAIIGDNFRDTIFVQSSAPNGHLLRGLARDGQASGARAPYAYITDIMLLGANALGPGNMVTRGIWLEDSDQDPENPIGGVLGHNAVIAERVAISNFSGAGFYCPKKRHGPKWRFNYMQGCGKQLATAGIATTDGSGQYEPNVYDNSDSDAEYLHCGSGGGGGDSYFLQNGETGQFDGGDCWASANPDLGYYAIRATGMDYLRISGMDINGKVYYKGNGAATPVASSQLRLLGNNFRFRKTSFGDDDLGQPLPLDSYVEFEDAPGVTCIGNTYTPYYDNTGTVAARPGVVYKTTGQTVVVSHDRFPSLSSNDWPAGAVIGPTPAISTLSNGLGTKLILCSGYLDDIKGFSILMQALQFAPLGGIYGRTDGVAVPAGMVGESAVTTVTTAAPVSITTATNTNILSVSITPGVYVVDAAVQFLVGSGSPGVALVRIGLGTTSASITTTTTTGFAERMLNVTVSGSFDRLELGGLPFVVSATTTYYLVARCNYTPGTVTAIGHIAIKRVG